ncbi:MAG: response regulator transcription factor [Archangium sp.]|nr:response regulator transcription factor [Archangium sp.]MDP3153598.1 response regulator transcription factor [Archangium sp.]MDP3569334.1 response regulator transcription factor [Archangium sp.]
MIVKEPTPVRVALVEDHAPTRAALEKLLAEFPALVTLAGSFASAEALRPALGRLEFEVALIDLHLPGTSGHALIGELTTAAPAVRSLALTAFDNEGDVLEAVRAGAFGYLLKDEPKARLIAAICEAAAGAHPVSSRVAGFLFAHTRRAPPPVSLSDREEELAGCLSEGLSYSECAGRMGISLGTVQDYVKRLYRKLDVNSKKEVRTWVAMHFAREPGKLS